MPVTTFREHIRGAAYGTGCALSHYLLWYFFDVRKTFHGALSGIGMYCCFYLMGDSDFVASLVKRMPLIAGGGIPQTRAANNGRIRYEHPLKWNWFYLRKCVGSVQGCPWDARSVQIGSYIEHLSLPLGTHTLKGTEDHGRLCR